MSTVAAEEAPPDVPEAASVARFEELADEEEAAGNELPEPGALEPCTEEEEVEGAGSLDRGTTVEASDEVPP